MGMYVGMYVGGGGLGISMLYTQTNKQTNHTQYTQNKKKRNKSDIQLYISMIYYLFLLC